MILAEIHTVNDLNIPRFNSSICRFNDW